MGFIEFIDRTILGIEPDEVIMERNRLYRLKSTLETEQGVNLRLCLGQDLKLNRLYYSEFWGQFYTIIKVENGAWVCRYQDGTIKHHSTLKPNFYTSKFNHRKFLEAIEMNTGRKDFTLCRTAVEPCNSNKEHQIFMDNENLSFMKYQRVVTNLSDGKKYAVFEYEDGSCKHIRIDKVKSKINKMYNPVQALNREAEYERSL